MLRLFSWNVNGLRAVLKKDALLPFLIAQHPDVLCLQEIKISSQAIDKELPKLLPDNDLQKLGYKLFWYPADKPGYSGTAIVTKTQPLSIVNGLPRDIIDQYHVLGDTYGDPNREGRLIAAEFDKFWLVTAYTPNAKDDLSRLELRQTWDKAITAYCDNLQKQKPVIYCGDMNVAHTEDDLANPKPNKGKKGFTLEERSGFDNWLAAGFVDTFRLFTQGNGYYTWWSHFANARARNVGWRIDYFLASKSLTSQIKSAEIHPSVTGSDHCPISLNIEI